MMMISVSSERGERGDYREGLVEAMVIVNLAPF